MHLLYEKITLDVAVLLKSDKIPDNPTKKQGRVKSLTFVDLESETESGKIVKTKGF